MAYEQEHPLINGASNNTTATQDTLGGGWMVGALSSSSDVDYFKLTTTSAALIKLELNNALLTSNAYWNLALLDGNGDYVTSLTSTVSGTPVVDGTNSGTTLAVTGLTSAVPAGSRFTFATSSADTTIYTVTSATALSSGSSTLTLDSSSSPVASTALIFDPAQTPAAGGLTTLTGQVAAAGTYFVKLSAASWSDAEYSVRASVLPTVESTGDNDTKGAAIPSSITDQNRPVENAWMTGHLSEATDADFWVFSTASMGGDIKVDFAAASGDNNAPEWDISLSQYASDQPLTTVQGVAISATAGASKTFTIEAAKYSTASTYVIEVLKPAGVTVDTGAYTLRVRGDTLDLNDTPVITVDSVTSTRPYDVIDTGVSRSVKAGADSKVALSTLFSVSDADAGQSIASYKVALSKASGEAGSVAGSIALIANGVTGTTYAMNTSITLTAAQMAQAYLLPGTVVGNLSLALQAFDSSGAADNSGASSVMRQTLRVVDSTVGVTATNDGTLSLTEGSSGSSETLSLSLATAPSGNVKVYIEQDSNNRFSFDKSVLTFTAANAAQSVVVTARDNQITEGAHTGQITFRVVSADSQYDGYSITPLTVAIADPANNSPSGSVTISGPATQGQTLAAANTLVDADGLGSIGYQWSAGGTPIGGAANATYVLTQSEVGKTVTVTASYTDLLGHAESVASSATSAVAGVSSGSSTPAPTPTTTAVAIDGATGSISTTTSGNQTTTTQTITPVSATRADDGHSANATLADIPLATASDGSAVVQVSLPAGVGVTSSAFASSSGTAQTLREQLIAASNISVSSSVQMADLITKGIDAYVPTVADGSQVTVRAITLTVAAGTTTASTETIHITGALGAGEGDLSHSQRQEALVIDASGLPGGSLLSLDNVEFAIVVGAAHITGGEGRNFVLGDASVQYMVLGADDDTLYGGGGNDTIGSRGGNDKLYGDAGNDKLVGGIGDDELHGGDGNDILQGGASDAGSWTFALDASGKMTFRFAASDTDLAGAASLAATGKWSQAPAARGVYDSRIGLIEQDYAQLTDIALLYEAVIGQRPDAWSINYLANLGLTPGAEAKMAYDFFAAHTAGAITGTLESQVRALLTQVWGSAGADMVAIGVDYLNKGGNWADGLLYLAQHANNRAKLVDVQGLLQLTTALTVGETGWSADAGNNQLFGEAGNDLLVGGPGSNLLDGGDGLDMAAFFGTLKDYTYSVQARAGGGTDLVLHNHLAGNTTDTLRNIEYLRMGDAYYSVKANLALTAAGAELPLAGALQIIGVADLQKLGVPESWFAAA